MGTRPHPVPRSALSPPPTVSTLSGRVAPPSPPSAPSSPPGSPRMTTTSTVLPSSTENAHERLSTQFTLKHLQKSPCYLSPAHPNLHVASFVISLGMISCAISYHAIHT